MPSDVTLCRDDSECSNSQFCRYVTRNPDGSGRNGACTTFSDCRGPIGCGSNKGAQVSVLLGVDRSVKCPANGNTAASHPHTNPASTTKTRPSPLTASPPTAALRDAHRRRPAPISTRAYSPATCASPMRISQRPKTVSCQRDCQRDPPD